MKKKSKTKLSKMTTQKIRKYILLEEDARGEKKIREGSRSLRKRKYYDD